MDDDASEPPSSNDDEPGREPIARFDLIDPAGLLSRAQRDAVRRRVGEALREIGRGGEVRVRIVDDAEMSSAHARYKNTPGTTDVLTFDLSEGGVLDTDLLVCLDEARRRADEMDHPPEHELILYIIHGVLHCVGFDDATPADADAMHREEDRILSAIGLGPVFARGRGVGGGRP